MSEIEILRAKAQAWEECVAWFAYWPQHNFGPSYRVSGAVLAEAEERNPYDHAITGPPVSGENEASAPVRRPRRLRPKE